MKRKELYTIFIYICIHVPPALIYKRDLTNKTNSRWHMLNFFFVLSKGFVLNFVLSME